MLLYFSDCYILLCLPVGYKYERMTYFTLELYLYEWNS